MVSQSNGASELYNLRWNSYFSNLINVFTDHQNQESLVDVTLSCEGQFVKAHRLILSACSVYFQKVFETHTTSQMLILLNDVKFKDLQLVIQFMYKGEVKVADSDMPQFLSLGKMLQVKGLCSVELQENQNSVDEGRNGDTKEAQISLTEKPVNDKTKISESKKVTCNKIVQVGQGTKTKTKETPTVAKKRKLRSPSPAEAKKKNVKQPTPDTSQDATRIPRPPNAFMIFANQWRKKLAVEYPNDSNKDISVRLGNMWKSLSAETKDAFYEDARRADEEHKIKYPGPKEARYRKAIANINKAAQKVDSSGSGECTEEEFIEIKFEETEAEDNERSKQESNGSN
ncbi:protein jim lovell-like isoform X3 [Tenebrio molitor]|uniref:protein jim lovell-like isoform X3 n=1 Tax=Tenebrio molitor TaxID=7067 RepID=UPI00362486D8